MQTESSPFLSLPHELRDHIYSFCVSYPDISQLFTAQDAITLQVLCSDELRFSADSANALVQFAGIDISGRPQMRECPTVFLLNKQTNHEATEMLQRKPLVIDAPITSREDGGLRFTDFIPEAALFLVLKGYSGHQVRWWRESYELVVCSLPNFDVYATYAYPVPRVIHLKGNAYAI